MGMYTHCRGWIEIGDIDFRDSDFDKLMEKAEDISERAGQCIGSTIFNLGFNMCPYIFIGGEVKNYDDDWDKFLNFLFENLKIYNYSIQTKYEEDEKWHDFVNKATQSGSSGK